MLRALFLMLLLSSATLWAQVPEAISREPYDPVLPAPSPVPSPRTPWEDASPLSLRGISLGTPAARVLELWGQPTQVLDPELQIYGQSIVVRYKNNRVSGLNGGGPGSELALLQGDRELVRVGMSVDEWLARGGPTPYLYKREEVQCLLYHGVRADVVIVVTQDKVNGFLVAEPQMAAWSLEIEGFKQEEPSVPSP